MKHRTIRVEDFSILDEMLDSGAMSQEEYDAIFTEARFHGLMNTPEAEEAGVTPILPFAIGGSDLAAIEGTSPYTSKRKLQRLKLGIQTEAIGEDKRFIFDFGHIFEVSIGKQCVKELSKKLGRNLTFIPCTAGYWNPEYPHFLAHPDGFILDLDKKEIIAMAEVKSTSSLSGNWKDFFSQGKVPTEYISQIQAYTKICKGKYPSLDRCYVLAWSGVRSMSAFAQIEVLLNDEYATNLLEAAEKFVDDTVRGIRYEATDIENTDLILKEAAEMYPTAKSDAEIIELGKDFDDVFSELNDLVDKQEALTAEIKAKEAEFKKTVESQTKELKEIEKAISQRHGMILDKVAANNGGTYTSADGTKWKATVKRDFSFDKEVKEYFKENFKKAWDAVTSKKAKVTIKVTREKPEEETA